MTGHGVIHGRLPFQSLDGTRILGCSYFRTGFLWTSDR